MNAVDLLRFQLKSSHDTQDATVADLTDESAHFNNTSKALPAGAAYAHSVISEDVVVSTMLAHKEPVSEDNPDTGLSDPMPSFSEWEKYEEWVKTVKIDLEKFKEFSKQVYQATDDYLKTLNEDDLDKEVDLGPMGKHTIADVISNFLILHTANLTGEVSAAKGFQGQKGYPF